MTTKRTPKKKSKTKKTKRGSQVKPIAVHDEAERAVAEAAIRALRETRVLLHAARDPKSSMAAYAKAYAGADEVAQKVLEAAEAEDEEEPDVLVIGDETWRCVLVSEATYQGLRGPIRKRRKLYRKERNGATRSFWEDRRGVMGGYYMPDLGRVVVESTSELPAERAKAILERATGQKLSDATMKRVTMSLGNELRDEENGFFNARVRHQAPPAEARTVVINVDALSFNIRGEGYKQATTAAISFLDATGERLKTIKLGEMPEENKPTIMKRVDREVRAIMKKRPDLKKEVVIDGAHDLRAHLQRLFPDAVHVTDFYHVVEYIADALRKLFPGDIKLRNEHRARLCHILKHEDGGATTVMNWIRDTSWILGEKLKEEDRHEVEGAASYIEGQLPFLNYAKAANDNLDLGSGVVEAACKTLVTQRLKISGAKWSRPGARAILYVRSLAQSGRLNDALDFHHATRLKRAA